MKNAILLFLALLPGFSFGQVLIETLDGDELLTNFGALKTDSRYRIITNINTSAEALQAKVYFDLNPGRLISHKSLILGCKVKSSEGVSALFTEGNINSGVTFSASYSQYIRLGMTYTVSGGYTTEQATLYYPEKDYGTQIEKYTIKGASLSGTLNWMLFNKKAKATDGAYLITIVTGYARKNNYGELKKVEVANYHFVPDPDDPSAITRYGSTVNARQGDYKAYDSYPLKLSLSYVPTEDPRYTNQLLFGATAYYSCNFGQFIPTHKIGIIGFMTKQDSKSGIRAPLFGIGAQLNDLTDNLDTGASIGRRISVNLSTTINLL